MMGQYPRGQSHDKREGYSVTIGQDKEMLHALEVVIPMFDREWQPELQAWWISKGYEKHLDWLFGEFGKGISQQGKLI